MSYALDTMNQSEFQGKNPRVLSVVIPCFNEEATIGEVIQRVLNQDSVREVIVINDASTDNSKGVIGSIDSDRLICINNTFNSGKGTSVKIGFGIATSKYVLIQDADLEYSPEEYPRLLKPLENGFADAVFGSRFLTYESRRALFFWHRVGNRLLTTLSNMLTNIDLTDMETGYKVMRIEFAKKIKINEKRFGVEPEITAKLAKLEARIYEVPISYRGRTFAEGKKISWKDGFSAIRCIVKYNILAK
jgi:glycosyltransferase involved in cell wall biosynthesis